MIVSIANLPKRYRGALNLVVNDRDFDVVARNTILLIILLTIDEPRTAAEYAVHIFYSAFITRPCHDALRLKIKPLIQEVCDKIAGRSPDTLFRKTWTFGECHFRLTLTKDKWLGLLSFFDVPEGLTKTVAQEVRERITCATERVDYVDRHLVCQAAEHRICIAKFRSDGLLLPFGNPRAEFEIPQSVSAKCCCRRNFVDENTGLSFKKQMSGL